MSEKIISISSSGMKNINLNKFTDEDDFILIFGQQEFRMKGIFAEFISPVISHLHNTDPTIQSIKFDDFYPNQTNDFAQFSKDLITDETISLLKEISSGYCIKINNAQAFKLRFLSIILGNEELFNKINELFPPELSKENFGTYLEHVQCCYYFSKLSPDFNFSSLIENISKNFYSIEPSEILKLPRTIQYSIITNPHLQIKTEDSFLDLICQIIDNQTFSDEIDSKEKIDNISFLEQVEFTRLSEEKLREFLTNYDFNRTTNSLWQKFYECFFIHFGLKPTKIESNHSNQENFEYNENQKNSI